MNNAGKKHSCTSFYVNMFSSLLGVDLGVQLQGHMVTLHLGGINSDLGAKNKPLDGIWDLS